MKNSILWAYISYEIGVQVHTTKRVYETVFQRVNIKNWSQLGDIQVETTAGSKERHLRGTLLLTQFSPGWNNGNLLKNSYVRNYKTGERKQSAMQTQETAVTIDQEYQI